MSITEKLSGALLDEASKWKLLRLSFPTLADRYSNEVAVSVKRSRFFRGYIQTFWYSKVAFWRFAPRHFIGALIPNVLGLQVIRHYCLNYLLRSKRSNDCAEFKTLEQNGVEKIPQLINKTQVEYALSFYNQNSHLGEKYLADFGELIINSNLPHISNPRIVIDEFSDFYGWLDEVIDFESMYYNVSGRQLRCKPWVSIIHNRSFPEDKSFVAQADGNNIPHRDVFYPSYKIFIYLNEVTEENAAFTYYPGSHQSSSDSAYRVYTNSLKHCIGRSSQPLLQISSDSKFVAQSYGGHAGDAVIFNVQGIHKRGQYKQDIKRERIVLLIDFRQNDALLLSDADKWISHRKTEERNSD